MRFQRVIQVLSLALFVWLLTRAVFPLREPGLPVDLYLRLDPLALTGTWLSLGLWLVRLWPALVVLLATLVLGRIFCGLLCPLGVTLDATDRLIRGPKPGKPRLAAENGIRLRRVKYHLLWWVLGSALLGVSLVFVLSPISLVTRFYGLVIFPLASALTGTVLDAARPLAEALDWQTLYFIQMKTPRFDSQVFLVLFLGGIFALARFSPRFWCRYLCPAGALFGLCSRRPLIRRGVADSCIDCGKCARACPMGAIPENDPRATLHAECIVCETCVTVCPVKAVSFSLLGKPAKKNSTHPEPVPEKPLALPNSPAWGRRKFIYSGMAGAGTALLAMTGLHSPHHPEGPGLALHPWIIRPPGAVPEPEFLDRCLRCDECMKACPTNTLQPIWFEAGFSGLFSPTVTPMRGPCEPNCNTCGQVCPTQALRALSPDEKIQAKIGTAFVLKEKCLAWEQQRKCLVCDEVCPYDAIELRQIPDNPAPVPFVHENKCAGCGFCQFNCPVTPQKAIQVQALGALRLSSGSYADAAREQGLSLSLKDKQEGGAEAPAPYDPDAGGLPPGFSELESGSLPPGFSEPPESGDDNLPPGFSNPPPEDDPYGQ